MVSSRTSAAVLLTIVVLLFLSWGLFFGVVLPGRYVTGTTTFGVGLAVTAFMLGMRHAFDADHIAAIDNATRKLIGERRDASAVGLWFALGHSTVVLTAVSLITAGLSAFTSQIGDDRSPLAAFTAIWGPTVSSAFLLVIGTVNLMALLGILRQAKNRTTESSEAIPGGVVMRTLRKAGGALDKEWKMFLVGVLFGLGFDTASTIALLLVAGGAGIVMPWYAAIVLPLLFTSGMVLCDGINSLLMSRAYAWTIDRSRRRVLYNATLMGISVVVAFLVGIVGIFSVLVDEYRTSSAQVRSIAGISLENPGFIVLGGLLIAGGVGFIIRRAWRGAERTGITEEGEYGTGRRHKGMPQEQLQSFNVG